MGRDLMLELEKSLSRVRYNNSFLFYRYQFDQSDLLQILWTPNFGTRRQISRLVSNQIKDLYEKEMDCYTIRWYTKDTADETTYTIEVTVQLLESVKIPIGNSVCVNDVHSSVHICTHILHWQIILSSATTQAKFEMFPAYYQLLEYHANIKTGINLSLVVGAMMEKMEIAKKSTHCCIIIMIMPGHKLLHNVESFLL